MSDTREAFLSIVAVEDTPDGPHDIDSIEGEELAFKINSDGELVVDNGFRGIYANGIYGIRDLTGDRNKDNVRLELRIIWQHSDDPRSEGRQS